MFNLASAPVFCPLPRFHPLHPPSSLCPIFLLLVFEPSSSPPPLNLSYLSSHYFSVLFLFSSWSLVCLALLLDYFGWVFASFFPPNATDSTPYTGPPSLTEECVRSVYTYHTQVDWREGLWHWQIIERVQHVVQVIFLGERHKKMKGKGREQRQSFICKRCWRCARRQS